MGTWDWYVKDKLETHDMHEKRNVTDCVLMAMTSTFTVP